MIFGILNIMHVFSPLIQGRRMKNLLSTSAMALVFINCAPAIAQEKSNTKQVETIVVTAERVSASAQKTAAGIGVISAATLQKNVTSVQDISKIVPAINIATAGATTNQIAIRGIGTVSGNAYSEPAVATNINGIYIARDIGTNNNLFDLERVEVLKGPQGTLYGRNATAGAMNILTRRPSTKQEGYVNLDLGNYNQRKLQAAYNLPITEKLALRLAGQYLKHDGYLTDGYNDVDSKSLRASLKIEASESTKLNLIFDTSKTEGMGFTGRISSSFPGTDPYTGPSETVSNLPYVNFPIPGGLKPVKKDGYVNGNTWGTSFTIDQNIGEGNLALIYGYRNSKTSYLHYTAGFPVKSDEYSDTNSLEIRYASPRDKKLSYIIGGYGFAEDQHFNLLADETVTYSDTRVSKLNNRSWALFGQALYKISDDTRASIGIRQSSDKKELQGKVTYPLPPLPYPPAILCPSPATYSASECTSPIGGNGKFSKMTWKASIEHDLSAQNLIYANVGTGFKAGGFFSSMPPNTFAPEGLTAYSVGSKNQFFNRSLQLNLEGYLWKYKDKQVTHLGPVRPAGFDLITENAGRATLYGLDMDMTWRVTSSDKLNLNLQYEHSKYDSFVFHQDTSLTGPPVTSCKVSTINPTLSSVDCSGNKLTKAPSVSGNIQYSKDFDIENGQITFNISERFESAYWIGDEQIADQKQKAYHMTDIDLTYTSDKSGFSASFYGSNLENEAVKSFSFVQPILGKSIITLRPPKTYGIRLNKKF